MKDNDSRLLSEAYGQIKEQAPLAAATPPTTGGGGVLRAANTAVQTAGNAALNTMLTPSITLPSIVSKLSKINAKEKLKVGMEKLLNDIAKEAKLTDKELALMKGQVLKFLTSNPTAS